MGCCGGRRKRISMNYSNVRWQGQGPIKVHGGVTGATYRFDGYGSVISIDTRDLGNVLSIPGMSEISQ